ncbi:MAG: 4Fe-4S dicluster domain-containing protein [Clostridia bacterium]|nr:4Fe-4S dicluster domain-containing protein [Clostridia bacterium]
MELKKLQKLIYEAGIVGAGGAGFPTQNKLSDKTEIILVNAAECEPLMMVDHHIFQKHLHLVVETLNMLLGTMGAKEAIIGIKGKNRYLLDPKVVADMEGTRIRVAEIPDIYPAGDEVVLTYETTGRIIPEGGIPLDVGVMVCNTETLFNIWKLFNEDTPVVEKYVTIGGDTDRDITVKVPVGMKISELFKACGYNDIEGKMVINGGPMMGKLVDIENDVVTKTTKGLLIFPKDHEVIQKRLRPMSITLKRASAACCECHMCTDMCPRHLLGYNLEVHKVLRAASHSEVSNTEAFLNASLCCGCGVCSVIACQQMLDPQNIAMEVKGELAKQGFRRPGGRKIESVSPYRAGRLVSSSVLATRLGLRRFMGKTVTRDMRTFDPKVVYIPTKQHVGAPAIPCVKVGDKVKRGDLIAKTPENVLGTTMHSSIDGTVVEVTDFRVVIKK